jgi:arylsulfatase A-like enzyme
MKVLVLQASALHLGFVGCYGNSWVATPHLDRLAAEAVVFDQHIVHELTPHLEAAPDAVDLLGRCRLAAEWVDARSLRADKEGTALEHALEGALTTLEQLRDQDSWLCWVDLPGLQPPWDLSDELARSYLGGGENEDDEPWEPLLAPTPGPTDSDDLELWERLRCTYAAAVSYLDSGVGVLCDELRQRGWLDAFTLVFTGDRGLALGEHGIVGDVQPWLHEEVVHLPLLIRQPGAADAGRRIAALTQPADLMATIGEWFEVPLPPTGGTSLVPLLRGDTDTVRQACVSHWQMGNAQEWALRTRAWAFLLPGPSSEPSGRGPQLYVKPEDRWEVNNVVQHHQELAEEMEKTLRTQDTPR